MRQKPAAARPRGRTASVASSSNPHSESARVEIFLILLEFRFDIGARVDTLRKGRDARGRENGLEAGAVAHNDFGERELAIVTEDERVAEDAVLRCGIETEGVGVVSGRRTRRRGWRRRDEHGTDGIVEGAGADYRQDYEDPLIGISRIDARLCLDGSNQRK